MGGYNIYRRVRLALIQLLTINRTRTSWMIEWLPLIIIIILGAIGLFARNWIKAWATKPVEHRFDRKLEAIRAEFRESEEKLKSNLRLRESELSALRDGVLSGRANRQALLDKRRLEAIDRVWAAIVALAPYKNIASSMAIINIEEVEKVAPTDPKVRAVFQMIGSLAPPAKSSASPTMSERPFISPLAWAYYSAYSSVVLGAYLQAKAFEFGLGKSSKIFNKEHVKDLLKAALPHQTAFIDEHGASAGYFLLDMIEELLLSELKKILEGKDLDEKEMIQAKSILEMAGKVAKDNENQAAQNSGAVAT